MTGIVDELEQSLSDICASKEQIAFSRLYPFSDLSRERLYRFRAVWDRLQPEQRRRILRRMVELAEASFRVSFGPIFRHSLDDSDDVVRATAIQGLWEDESSDLIGPFIRMLRTDPFAHVRAAAACGLGRFVLAGELEKLEPAVQQRIITELLTVVHMPGESSQVRRRAIESVAYACLDEVGQALELAYDDDDEAMQISAMVGMGRSCDRRWKPIILRELESPVAAMRYEAAVACGELGLRQAVPLLAELLYDPDREIVMATIWALGQIGTQEAKHALLAAYDDADADERRALDDAMAEHALASGDLDFSVYGPDLLQQAWNGETLPDFVDADDDDLEEFDSPDWTTDG